MPSSLEHRERVLKHLEGQAMDYDREHSQMGIAGKHTPGPWAVLDGVIVCADNLILMGKHRQANEARANAHLIAAAPDLLVLVKLFEKSVEYEIRRSQKDGDTEGANLKTLTLNLIRTAIAKAEAV